MKEDVFSGKYCNFIADRNTTARQHIMMKELKITALLAAVTILFTQCWSQSPHSGKPSPATPDYNDATQWYVADRHGEADLFYIVSTETSDYTLADGTTYHHADTHNDSIRELLHEEMQGVDILLSGNLNFFSPYYRQCTLETFVSDSLTAERLPVASDDVRRAFRHYLKYMNNGRPFILAGFSQGAMILLDVLKEMDDDTYSRMIAAYIIGMAISQDVADSTPHIVAAQDSGDTGVTICYNSVRDASCSLWPRSAAGINPVNWRTDSTPAMLITEPSPFIPLQEQNKDTLTVHLDEETNMLCVEGYTGTDYQLPLIGKEGNYHSREIWFYRDQLRENMALRAARFLDKNK